MSAYGGFSTRETPQGAPLPGREAEQVKNSAGGYVFAVDEWTRLHRFLILGSDGGSYYASQQNLTAENAGSVLACVKVDGLRTVREIVDVSTAGRAPKNDPAIFALALCSAHGDQETRSAAHDALLKVCRTGTHLFTFVDLVEKHRGWGRSLRRGVGEWYTSRTPDELAYQLVKYRSRKVAGSKTAWTHRDVLRLAHLGSAKNAAAVEDDGIRALLAWVTGSDLSHTRSLGEVPPVTVPDAITAFEAARAAETSAQVAELVRQYGGTLPHEAIPDELKGPEVWDAMLPTMPMTALIRNLPTMTRLGVLTPAGDGTQVAVEKLSDENAIRRARVHPLTILKALLTYRTGRSMRGDSTWTPVPRVIDALDAAFYLAFKNVEPTGQSRLVAIDASGSMSSGCVGGVQGLTPRVAAAALAMVTAHTGDPYQVVVFTSSAGGYRYRTSGGITPVDLTARQRLDDACRVIDRADWGGTDCSLPMLWALDQPDTYGLFEVYTDNETWHGSVHPSQALRTYRERRGVPAKLAVVGMVSNGFSIADPADAGMMDFVGFDTAAPAVLHDFATGELGRA